MSHHLQYLHLGKSGDVGKARALGFVSLAIGLTEIAAPKQVERLLGIGDGDGDGNGDGSATKILRMLGVREILHGVDILSHDDPAPGVRARVGGDLLDGVLLAVAGAKTKNVPGFLTACALVLPVVVADMVLAGRLGRRRGLPTLLGGG